MINNILLFFIFLQACGCKKEPQACIYDLRDHQQTVWYLDDVFKYAIDLSPLKAEMAVNKAVRKIAKARGVTEEVMYEQIFGYMCNILHNDCNNMDRPI